MGLHCQKSKRDSIFTWNSKENFMRSEIKIKDIDVSWVLIIYIALKPLYLSASGTMQICDLFFAAAVAYLAFVKGKFIFSRDSFSAIKLLLILVFYIIMVNGTWFILTEDRGLLVKSLFYVFNLISFCVCCLVATTVGLDKLKRAIAKGCCFSALLTAVGIIIYRGLKARNTGFFNNPNQLGYYSLIILTALLLWPAAFTTFEKLTVATISVWATISSGSKAAIIGLAFMLFIYIVIGRGKITKKKLTIQIALLILLLAAVYYFLYGNSTFISSNATLSYVRYRILHMASENDSSFGFGRGYNRVFEMGSNVFWGMGEGAFDRFQTLRGLEVHSTYASILVSYGIWGTLLFVVCLKKIIIIPGYVKRNLCCLTGIAMYSLTHNGIRNTLIWILFAVMFLEAEGTQKENRGMIENEIENIDQKE